jgi:Protein of unknown function (DUF3007)
MTSLTPTYPTTPKTSTMVLHRSFRMTVFAVCSLMLGIFTSSDAFVAPKVLSHPTVSAPSSKIHFHGAILRPSGITTLQMAADPKGEKNLPMLLDPGTKGGALFLSLVLFIIPLIGYQFCVSVLGFDGIEAGRWIGVGFTLLTTVLWVGTYIVRVATKDMTYVSME